MATKIIIPPTGQKESTGTIGIWYKKEGDFITKGDKLCTIETEKASIEIESPCSGILRIIFSVRDTEVSEGDCIAIISEADEDISSLEMEIRLAK